VIARPQGYLGNLPVRATRFIGHDDEVRRLALRLADNPMVTVIGPGGVGKTSVAIEVARRCAADFPDGIWFLNLALLDEGSDVVPFVCEALRGVVPVVHDATSLASAIGDRRLLLLFDSCEHVLRSVGELIARIAELTKRVRIIATSREPLAIDGEVAHRLEAFSVEDAVALFVDRARIAGIELAEHELPTAAAVVARLDLIPLAIELAAPQLSAMSPQELLKHVDDRLQLLTLENRGAPSRQQTLEAMHDWSHRLLSANAQRLFRRLAIFVGGFTLEAAMRVCTDETFNEARLAEALAELLGKSLVVSDDVQERARYRMLETTRAYAQGRLLDSGEYDEAAQAHVRYFVSLARRFEAILEATPVLRWQAMVMLEAPNFRAALSLALDAGDIEGPAEICEALHNWLWTHGSVHASDLRRRLATVLATTMKPSIEAPLRLAYAALMRRTDRNDALQSAKRAWQLYRTLKDVTHAADALRSTDTTQLDVSGGSSAEIRSELERYAGLMLERGSTLRAAELLNNLGVNYVEMLDEDRMADATDCFERAASLLEARGDRERAGRVIGNSAVTAHIAGDSELAVRLSRRAVIFFDEVPDSREAGHQWNNLGYHLTTTQRYPEAREAIQRAICIARDQNDREGLAAALESAAQYHISTGTTRLAARLLGSAETLMPGDLARQAREASAVQALLDAVRATLGEQAYEEEYQRGAGMPADDIMREAQDAI
jgi:predicted ATPase